MLAWAECVCVSVCMLRDWDCKVKHWREFVLALSSGHTNNVFTIFISTMNNTGIIRQQNDHSNCPYNWFYPGNFFVRNATERTNVCVSVDTRVILFALPCDGSFFFFGLLVSRMHCHPESRTRRMRKRWDASVLWHLSNAIVFGLNKHIVPFHDHLPTHTHILTHAILHCNSIGI